MPSLVDDGDAAQALHDVAALRSYPLDDPGGALESIRAAFARRPALHIARAYRKAAHSRRRGRRSARGARGRDRAGADAGAIARRSRPSAARCYERAVGNLAAARQSYAAAVEINPSDVTALLALLRLALRDGDRASGGERAARRSRTPSAIRA